LIREEIMRKNFFFPIAMMSVLVLAFSCANQTKKGDAVELQAKQIKEYEGAELGSISDFRENSIRGPQFIDQDKYKLEITGLVENETKYAYEEILSSFQKYKKVITIHCVEGWNVKILWEGFLVDDFLKKAVVKPEAKTVIFHAYDGYTTSFPLDYLLDSDIIMAYKMNEVTMPKENGFPFQLVAEDKWGYKWIKWITKIELSDKEDYRGYWEGRGYNNDGDVKGPIFEGK
jgi:DMSO/TMAO reductase YedYZ molybdopterin-dependent catalytic subunit